MASTRAAAPRYAKRQKRGNHCVVAAHALSTGPLKGKRKAATIPARAQESRGRRIALANVVHAKKGAAVAACASVAERGESASCAAKMNLVQLARSAKQL